MERPLARKPLGKRSGFTTLELAMTCTLVGLIALIGAPKFRYALTKERTRSAIAAVAMHTAVARETAISRGCPTTAHFSAGSDGKAWVTSCKTVGTGLDTIGSVDPVASRFSVTLAVTIDSVRFFPSGLRADYETTQVTISAVGNSAATGTVSVNQLGKAVVSQ